MCGVGQTRKLGVLCESLPRTRRQGFNNFRDFRMDRVGYPTKIILGQGCGTSQWRREHKLNMHQTLSEDS